MRIDNEKKLRMRAGLQRESKSGKMTTIHRYIYMYIYKKEGKQWK